MKDFAEFFGACGAEVIDGGFIKMNHTEGLKPMEIALKVVPTDIDFENQMITFRALIDDRLEGTPIPGQLRHTEYNVEFDLPLDAIELVHV